MSVNVAVGPVRIASNTWPGAVVGMDPMLYPLYDIQAWLAFFGSTAIAEIARFGGDAPASRRVQTTDAAAAASTLSEINTRPAPVAAQRVLVFCGVRGSQATAPPARVAP